MGIGDIIVNDRSGILCAGDVRAPAHHVAIAARSNRERRRGGIAEAVYGADIFIGVSVAGQLSGEMIRTMRPSPIILALANPTPEVMPEEAAAAGAAIVATGRFDYPNQCNNVLAFPALMRAAIDTRARRLDQTSILQRREPLQLKLVRPNWRRLISCPLHFQQRYIPTWRKRLLKLSLTAVSLSVAKRRGRWPKIQSIYVDLLRSAKMGL